MTIADAHRRTWAGASGVAVGMAAHTSWARAALVGLVDCAMGVAIVAFKVLVIH